MKLPLITLMLLINYSAFAQRPNTISNIDPTDTSLFIEPIDRFNPIKSPELETKSKQKVYPDIPAIPTYGDRHFNDEDWYPEDAFYWPRPRPIWDLIKAYKGTNSDGSTGSTFYFEEIQRSPK